MPPTIIAVRPSPGAINIPLDTRFHILFSKPMNPEKTVNAVFLTPVFWEYPEYKWKGKELIVIPPEDLGNNKTYVLTVGADATELHGNRMGISYSFAFSTGEVIDSGSISGSVYLAKGSTAAYDVWAYSLVDTASVAFLMNIPDYATQIDSLHEFAIKNIAPGSYVVVAVDDRNDDLFWDPTSESIGLPPLIINLAGRDNFGGLVIKPERRDTIPAVISRVRTLDNRKITAELSQPVLDKSKLDIAHYRVIGTDSIPLAIEGSYIGEEGILVLETSVQEPGKTYTLRPETLFSLWGNSFDTQGARFAGSPETDSTGPGLIRTTPSKGTRTAFKNDKIELIFSERIRALGFFNSVIVVADSSDTLGFVPEWIAPNIVQLKFAAGIPRRKNIDVILNPAEIFDVAGNPMRDSLPSFAFRIAPEDTVGAVTLKAVRSGNMLGELYSKEAGNETYKSEADKNGVFSFDFVLPGSYYFIYFEDADSNGIWTPGVINPFRPAEWFYFYRDSIDVRARWTTEMGQIN